MPPELSEKEIGQPAAGKTLRKENPNGLNLVDIAGAGAVGTAIVTRDLIDRHVWSKYTQASAVRLDPPQTIGPTYKFEGAGTTVLRADAPRWSKLWFENLSPANSLQQSALKNYQAEVAASGRAAPLAALKSLDAERAVSYGINTEPGKLAGIERTAAAYEGKLLHASKAAGLLDFKGPDANYRFLKPNQLTTDIRCSLGPNLTPDSDPTRPSDAKPIRAPQTVSDATKIVNLKSLKLSTGLEVPHHSIAPAAPVGTNIAAGPNLAAIAKPAALVKADALVSEYNRAPLSAKALQYAKVLENPLKHVRSRAASLMEGAAISVGVESVDQGSAHAAEAIFGTGSFTSDMMKTNKLASFGATTAAMMARKMPYKIAIATAGLAAGKAYNAVERWMH